MNSLKDLLLLKMITLIYSDNDEIPNLDDFDFKSNNRKKYVMFNQKLCIIISLI